MSWRIVRGSEELQGRSARPGRARLPGAVRRRRGCRSLDRRRRQPREGAGSARVAPGGARQGRRPLRPSHLGPDLDRSARTSAAGPRSVALPGDPGARARSGGGFARDDADAVRDNLPGVHRTAPGCWPELGQGTPARARRGVGTRALPCSVPPLARTRRDNARTLPGTPPGDGHSRAFDLAACPRAHGNTSSVHQPGDRRPTTGTASGSGSATSR